VARLKERVLDLAVLFDFDHWTAVTDYDGRAVCDDRDIGRVLGSPSDCSPWGLDLRGLCSRAQVEPAFESCYRTVDFGSLQVR